MESGLGLAENYKRGKNNKRAKRESNPMTKGITGTQL